jgi:hypothetical protein
MKRSSILSGVFILCFWIVLVQSSQAAPQLEVINGPTFDFGDVQANQTLTHIFVLKNSGDSVLKIEQASGG